MRSGAFEHLRGVKCRFGDRARRLDVLPGVLPDVLAFSRHAVVGIALCFILLSSACAVRLPEVPTAAARPAVFGSKARQDGLNGLAAGDERQRLLARHVAGTEAATAATLSAGNDARLLIDGPQTQQAMLEAVRAARHRIDFETYIIEPGEIGDRLGALLVARAAQGVSIRLIYDSLGSLATPATYFDHLTAAGITVCAFNPLVARESDQRLSINNRDHRKILIVDGKLAMTGGINISDVYSSGSFSRRARKLVRQRAATEKLKSGWRDTHVVVRGPVVAQFSRLFEETWRNQQCPGALPVGQRAIPAPAGTMAMQLSATDPATERSDTYLALLSAIGRAQRRVWLTYGYFVPDPAILGALEKAARRGVDVRLILPGFSDFWATFHAGRANYDELLRSGIRIFERRDALLHAKTAVIDGVWSTVGSTNLDWRSFAHNYEANLLILDASFAGQMERLFALDESASHEIVPSEWKKRDLSDRLLEWLARRMEYLL